MLGWGVGTPPLGDPMPKKPTSDQDLPESVQRARAKLLTKHYNLLADFASPEQIDETLTEVWAAGFAAAKVVAELAEVETIATAIAAHPWDASSGRCLTCQVRIDETDRYRHAAQHVRAVLFGSEG